MNMKEKELNLQSHKQLMITPKKIWLILSIVLLSIPFIGIKFKASPTVVPDKNLSLQKVVHESELNTVLLNDESIQKLGIDTTFIKPQTTTERKSYGADILVPTGGLVTISAPVTGKLISDNKALISAGSPVKAGQILYRIQPMITADARANLVNALSDAESMVSVAKSQAEATEITLSRARKLLHDLVGSQRSVDDANAAHEIALRNLEAAEVKKNALQQVVKLGIVQAVDIKSPQSGIVSNIFASNNQVVSAGNPVIEVSAVDSLWIRVPIPSGDFDLIDPLADAVIEPTSISKTSIVAKPVSAPPTADPLTNSTHLYYAVPNIKSTFRPMQRVTVALKTLGKTKNTLSIPWSSIVYDIHGNTWVYVQESSNLYLRKRVFLDHVIGNQALIHEGLSESAKVVVNGALELFSIETGFSH